MIGTAGPERRAHENSSPDDATRPAGRPLVAVTGATGYVGGRLVPALLQAGFAVRCLVRSPRKLADRPWAADPGVEIVEWDAGDLEATRQALDGCQAAYYLVHSMMSAGRAYSSRDREFAGTFAAAAGTAGLPRIIYLGGLGELGDRLSRHLRSRREVAAALAEGGTPVTELRAAMIIGAGSASFEILRYLVERLPVMVTPRWVMTESQPIDIRNVVRYLVQCLAVPATTGRTLDIGGPDVLTYRELMALVAEIRGLPRRLIVPVPVLSPRLSALWIHLVTPISRRIAMPLAEGLRNRVVCRDAEAARLMPQRLYSVREALTAALDAPAQAGVETSWSGAGPIPGDPDWAGGTVFRDRREVDVSASAEHVFQAVCRVGGGHGWYGADWLWRLRGFLDRLVGGPGLRRGRRDPEHVAYGEALDFWRVTGIERDRRLALRAEMRLPGEALLEFSVERLTSTDGRPRTRLVQTARFLPRGLAGLAYWYAVLPVHGVVFRGMLEGIRQTAEALERRMEGGPPPVSRGRAPRSSPGPPGQPG